MALQYFARDTLPFRAKVAEARSWEYRHINGFYTDTACSETIVPHIFFASGKDKKPRVLCGYQEPLNDGYVVDMSTIYDDEGDAGERAFDVAKGEAESQYEADEAYQAGNEAAHIVAELAETKPYLDNPDKMIVKFAKETVYRLERRLETCKQYEDHDSYKEGYDNADC